MSTRFYVIATQQSHLGVVDIFLGCLHPGGKGFSTEEKALGEIRQLQANGEKRELRVVNDQELSRLKGEGKLQSFTLLAAPHALVAATRISETM
jgi:hypothetical protein